MYVVKQFGGQLRVFGSCNQRHLLVREIEDSGAACFGGMSSSLPDLGSYLQWESLEWFEDDAVVRSGQTRAVCVRERENVAVEAIDMTR